MPPVNLLNAGTVMRASASLNNDTARSTYTYTAQIPFLNMALQELQEYFELHSVPVTEKTSTVIPVDAGQTIIGYTIIPAFPLMKLPPDMIEPTQLWERNRDIDPFIPMTRKDYLPHNLQGILTNQFIYYTWQNQEIEFLESNQDNDIKIDYIRRLFTEMINETSPINVINAQTFLEYRTGSLCAEFIGEDETRATKLNNYAGLALDRATGITVKGKQTIQTRRRPFRAAFKRRRG